MMVSKRWFNRLDQADRANWSDRADRGGALVLVLLLLLLFTLLGAAVVRMGHNEMEQGGLQVAQQEAGYLAESGIDLASGWFARPERFAGAMAPVVSPCPAPARVQELFAKRCRHHNGRLSFLTDDGTSQFQGTPEMPDGSISLPASSLLPEPIAMADGGTIEVMLFGPSTPGAMCTVQATGRMAGGASRTIRVEFYETAVPTLTAAASAGTPGPAVGPVRIHWGQLRYEGDGRLPADPDEVPMLTPLAPVDGQSYDGPEYLDGRIDQWMNVTIGGRLLEPMGDAAADLDTLERWAGRSNVRINVAAPTDGNSWSYPELKRLARRFGRYYATDPSGRLYRDGLPPALEADVVFGDDGGGASEPDTVFFIDTIDGQPPRSGPDGNLPVITLSRSIGHHVAYIGANLVLDPSASHVDPPDQLTVPAPVTDGGEVELDGVSFSGGFYVAGRLMVVGTSRVFGAVYAAGGFEGTEQLELWYDRSLGTGVWPDWPVVSRMPGSWRLIAQ
jgi:PilX N-terminal